MAKQISVLGCGWLGLPLAQRLVLEGNIVKGSTTSKSKLELIKQKGIKPYLLRVNSSVEGQFADFFDTDILILNIPPRRLPDIVDVYPRQVASVVANLAQGTKLLFVSSTSVYPSNGAVWLESSKELTPDKTSGRALLHAENAVKEKLGADQTIVRMGGLIGADRNPSRFLVRKKKPVNPVARVNLIHLDDAMGVLLHIIQNDLWGDIFNACCLAHPTKKAFYSEASRLSGLDLPEFAAPEWGTDKEICSKKIIDDFGYRFKYISPLDAIQ